MNSVEIHAGAHAPADAGAEPPHVAELPFVQVAFAGHNRTEDLGDVEHVEAGLAGAFDLLRQAGVKDARLVTGLAPGADLLAAKAWRAAGLGPIQAVFPFIDDEVEPWVADLMECGTWLDGKATETVGRNPYLAQTRWLIGAADLLAVVWTGETARGAGGTADAVRLALEHGIPVLWVKPGEPNALRLIRPEHLDEDFGFLEFLEELKFGREPLVRAATGQTLRQALFELGLGGPEPEIGPPVGLPARSSRIYANFRRLLGGKPPPYKATPTPADLAAQPGFERMSEAQAAADRRANSLGATHRSHQVLLLGVMILAAFAGSISGLIPDIEVWMALFELFLTVVAYVIWSGSERENRHHRWGVARRLAEDLRLERVAWVLGVSTVPHGVNPSSSHVARHVRRLAGLPQGVFNAARVSSWGEWAMDELISGQAAYHRAQSIINGHISHRVHQLENVSGWVLFLLLLSFVSASLGIPAFRHHAPEWMTGVVMLAGAIVPAITAAALALEATLSLGEQAQRSRILATRLEALTHDLRSPRKLETYQAAAKAAIRLQRAQEDHWTEGVVRRRLFRGG